MTIEIRVPTAADWPVICRVDARAFGNWYTDEDVELARPAHDISRFRVAFDGEAMVGVAGSYALDVTLPGGTTVPFGGVTWVCVAATHRRQGIMRRVVEAVHADIDSRGEPVASLYASEGSIYRHLGYGPATARRVMTIDARHARLR
ncbi:MAG TPA: GNAT family N-acetyltransferase, partial [Ilumatobacteraceae bacterium]|nr:GNAT family N-acetyltransferase [Ilumatobacteraceae bacterium]